MDRLIKTALVSGNLTPIPILCCPPKHTSFALVHFFALVYRYALGVLFFNRPAGWGQGTRRSHQITGKLDNWQTSGLWTIAWCMVTALLVFYFEGTTPLGVDSLFRHLSMIHPISRQMT